MNLLIDIQRELIKNSSGEELACEDFLLRSLSPLIRWASEELENDRKDSREKTRLEQIRAIDLLGALFRLRRT